MTKQIINIAELSINLLQKEIVNINLLTIKQSIEGISAICSFDTPETDRITSLLLEDNHVIHAFSFILSKCPSSIRETCLFLLANLVVNSAADALKII